MKTIQEVLEWLQKSEDEGIYEVGTQNVKRHLESVLNERLRQCNVSGRSEQLKCEHKGRRTATELVEYCEDCKKILFHP